MVRLRGLSPWSSWRTYRDHYSGKKAEEPKMIENPVEAERHFENVFGLN